MWYKLVGKKIKRVPPLEAAENFEIWNRRAALTEVDTYTISTVFLGIDHGFGNPDDPKYRPILFETMVFDESNGSSEANIDECFNRYCTYDEAVDGHNKIVELIKEHIYKVEIDSVTFLNTMKQMLNELGNEAVEKWRKEIHEIKEKVRKWKKERDELAKNSSKK